MPGKKVLFVCTHNSARSQIAEAYMKQMAGERFAVESAGFEPGPLNPLAVEVMREDGVDISGHKARSVFELFKQGRVFEYVITVCESSRESECPMFPGITRRLHMPFDDPSQLTGSHEEQLAAARVIRDRIKQTVADLISELA
ncbi:MAG: arsenate reductase ArsC [Desulfarculaceae bacterium]|nr:arsenate reductase ArsC [Desulfarculaceae bacterium]MCF8072656.1 arsenate reductase ArsC [Desulfarculaceae bacterium]MCF8102535.1 arsenate reductase ArsC [Desulfarculaceae bacterium]MCF8116444.1 arsenate reductase ArsC [Desulfarculaceae bacterium]